MASLDGYANGGVYEYINTGKGDDPRQQSG